MARTLSRVQQGGMLILWAATAALTPVRGRAESDVKVTPVTQVVPNPFAKHESAPRPVTVAPTTTGQPATYHNPFSGDATRPRMLMRVPRTAPGDRWRRSLQVPGSPRLEAQAGSETSGDTSSAPDDWDVLTPAELRQARAARLESNDPAKLGSTASRQDAAQFAPRRLAQPPWLLPEAGAKPPAVKDLFRLPSGADRRASSSADEQIGSAQRRVAPEDQTAAKTLADPFESASADQTVVTDVPPPSSSGPSGDRQLGSPVVLAGHTTSVATAPEADQLYVEAQKAAEAAESLDELAEVLRLCQQGLAQQPERELARSLRSLAAWAHNRRGESIGDAGQTPGALAEFNAAIELDPNCWLALHNRAITSAAQGQAEAALGDLNRVVELNPGLAAAYRNRGELLAALDRTEEAVEDYGRALVQLPNDAQLYDMRGHALHRLGLYEEAIDDLNQAIQLDPRNAEPYVHRGNVYAELGDYERAFGDLEEALVKDDRHGDAYRSVAWLMATCPDPQFHDAEQALAAAKVAAKLSPPGDPFVLDALAAAHAIAGQFDEAVRCQQQAIAVAPESFAPQFAARLELYRQRRPFLNDAGGIATDDAVRQASHESRNSTPESSGSR